MKKIIICFIFIFLFYNLADGKTNIKLNNKREAKLYLQYLEYIANLKQKGISEDKLPNFELYKIYISQNPEKTNSNNSEINKLNFSAGDFIISGKFDLSFQKNTYIYKTTYTIDNPFQPPFEESTETKSRRNLIELSLDFNYFMTKFFAPGVSLSYLYSKYKHADPFNNWQISADIKFLFTPDNSTSPYLNASYGIGDVLQQNIYIWKIGLGFLTHIKQNFLINYGLFYNVITYKLDNGNSIKYNYIEKTLMANLGITIKI